MRQGCPLAPLLYLFAGQALLCHFKQLGVGIQVAGSTQPAAQYADDVEPLVPDFASVPSLVAGLQTFGAASGQFLNPSKSRLLLLGRQPTAQPVPAAVAGLEVVQSAASLGIVFAGQGVEGCDWDARMAKVRSRLQRISRLPGLSAFGRAFAANSYALSSLLYAAQYTGVVPAQQAAELTVWTSALVDAGLGPDGDVVRGLRRPPGIPANCMMAHPRDGGFGLLPVQQHLFSRWACEAVQLLLGDAAKRWIAAGRAVLRHCADAGPAIAGSVWDLALCGREWLFPGQNAAALLFSLPEPLRAMALGLRALPPLEYVGPEQALAPGPWCYNAPLFDNPLTAARQQWDWFGQQREVAVGLDYVLPSLVGLPKLRSVGQAVSTLRLVENIAGISDPGMRQEAYRLQVWQPVLAGRPYYSFIGHAVADLGRLVGALPPPWVAAARAVEQACYSAGQLLPVVTDAGLAAAWARMAPHLGWRLPYGGGVVRLAALTVKLATRLQARNVQAAIDARHDAFITSVRALDAG